MPEVLEVEVGMSAGKRLCVLAFRRPKKVLASDKYDVALRAHFGGRLRPSLADRLYFGAAQCQSEKRGVEREHQVQGIGVW